MTWWNSFSQWLSSSDGSRVITDAVLPFVAIVVAGVLAALIARGMTKRVLELHESESKTAAVASIVAVARKATVWDGLDEAGRAHAEHLGDEASVRLRLLPIAGAGLAAAWSDHEVETIKRNSATFSFQAEQSFNDLRDRLVDWQAKPGRARKLFRADLDRWRLEEEHSQAQKQAGAGGHSETGSSARAGVGSLDEERVQVPAQVSPANAPLTPAAPERVTPQEPAARFAPPTASVIEPAEAPAHSSPATTPAEAPTTEAQPAFAPSAPASKASAVAEPTVVSAPATTASPSAAPAAATAPAAPHVVVPERKPTGMVSTPVVQPPYPAAPASPSDAADQESRDAGDHDAAYSAPVSAHNVRRRTSPDA